MDLLQPSPHTWEERYPALFDALAERLAHFPQPRLLSFGCSTGEEVRALRRRLPDALIDAVEVNPRSIARARAAGSDPKTRYIVADRPDPAARYDAVLALAVFRHRELEGYAPSSCAGILPFASAAQAAARLDAVLVPGGWLAFANANFCLLDLLPDAGYAPEPERFGVPEAVTLYGPDDMRLSGEVYTPVLFRKPAS
ncbi:MAG: class I SAM-dependent methyltransferase [Sphingomonadales bacterium]|nr:class I SAM-dependent methyltransferase [Sphingomonadales bacterium]MBD3773928.1 class I SAM-dependent methyltransferase [Paracoccaceae bacterium]